MLAASNQYPILAAFWWMLMFFLFVVWIFILFHVIVDIFRSHDMGGFAKALWLLFIIVAPFLGVLIYLIARGHKMAQHQVQAAQQQRAEFDAYVRRLDGRRAREARGPEGEGLDLRRRLRGGEGEGPLLMVARGPRRPRAGGT